MLQNTRGWILAGTIASGAFSASCGGGDEPPLAEEVDVVMDPLQLYQAQNDPLFSGGAPTVCTVGGVTMHCCPQWQTGSNHFVMIGYNLSTNTFRCARLDDHFPHRQAVILAPAGTTQLQDGITFDPACPGGYAMVGLHWDLKRVACARAMERNPSENGLELISVVDYTPPFQGFKYCGNFSGSTSAGRIMQGIARNNPNILRCLH